MGHMAHVSRLPGSGNWGIHIGKEPHVGATLITAPDDEWRNHRTANKVIMCTRNRRPSDPRHTMSLADKEDATMKKKTLSILSLCIALFAAFALVGCGGNASGGGSSASKSEGKEKAPVAKKTDFIWFKVEMPEGVGVSDSAGKNADRVQLTFPENENTTVDRFIPVWEEKMTAEEALADEGRKSSMFQWEVGDPVEYNGRTWLTGTCKDNGGTYTYLFTDVDTGSIYIMIRNVDLHVKEAEALLNSIEFPDDMKEAVKEARGVEISSIEIK